MSLNKINSGKVWDHVVAGSAIVSGEMVLIGDCVGVATVGGAVGETIAVEMTGTFDLPKKAADVVTVGLTVYYRAAGPDVTITASTNKIIGYAVEAAAGGDATTRVRLKL